MIDCQILRLMQKTCPNYHIVSQAAARSSSVCVCASCRRSVVREKSHTHCADLLERLTAAGFPAGHSRVDACATCDRAKSPQLTLPLDAAANGKGKIEIYTKEVR